MDLNLDRQVKPKSLGYKKSRPKPQSQIHKNPLKSKIHKGKGLGHTRTFNKPKGMKIEGQNLIFKEIRRKKSHIGFRVWGFFERGLFVRYISTERE